MPILLQCQLVMSSSCIRPINQEKLGRVKEVLIGGDEKIRGAVVRVAEKGRQAKLLQRPLQLLYPLEIRCPSSESEPEAKDSEQHLSVAVSPGHGQNPSQETSPDDYTQAQPQKPPRRSGRHAAFEARDRLMAQALSQTEEDDNL